MKDHKKLLIEELSNCCNSPVRVGGEGLTHYYVCTGCNCACDIKVSKYEADGSYTQTEGAK